MDVKGRTLIFKSDYGYSTAISNKKQDGAYERMYLSLQLPKGVELQNKTFIEITRGFLSFYKDRNGIAKPKIIVMEFQEDYEKEEREAIQTENTAIDYSEDDLPF